MTVEGVRYSERLKRANNKVSSTKGTSLNEEKVQR